MVSRAQICLWNNRWLTRLCQVLLSVLACSVALIVCLMWKEYNLGCGASSSILQKHVLMLACYSQFCFSSCPVPVARAVLIDMEPKVISQTLSMAARSGYWKYHDGSHFCQKQGSGNNWANGYEQQFQASLATVEAIELSRPCRSGSIAAV